MSILSKLAQLQAKAEKSKISKVMLIFSGKDWCLWTSGAAPMPCPTTPSTPRPNRCAIAQTTPPCNLPLGSGGDGGAQGRPVQRH